MNPHDPISINGGRKAPVLPFYPDEPMVLIQLLSWQCRDCQGSGLRLQTESCWSCGGTGSITQVLSRIQIDMEGSR